MITDRLNIPAAPCALHEMFYPPYCVTYYFLMKCSAQLWHVRDSPYEKRVFFIRRVGLYKDNLDDSNVFYLAGIAAAGTGFAQPEISITIVNKTASTSCPPTSPERAYCQYFNSTAPQAKPPPMPSSSKVWPR